MEGRAGGTALTAAGSGVVSSRAPGTRGSILYVLVWITVRVNVFIHGKNLDSSAVKVLVLLIGFVGANLHAATIIARFNGEITSEAIQRDVGDGAGFVDTTTGMFSFLRTGGTLLGDPSGTFFAFCIEPREFVSSGQTYTYNFSNLEQGATNIGGMGAAKADLIRELFGRYYPVIGASLDALHASAMQIAIWEIVRENSGTLNVTTGNVMFRNAADAPSMTLAQTYLSSLNGSGPKLTNLYALTNVGAQDVIVQVNSPAPEPGVLVTAGLGLIGIALLARRRRARC